MANGRVHAVVGAASGAALAAYRGRSQELEDQLVEVLGGALGGYVGGKLPDWIEPAVSSWHRDIAHSWTTGGGIVTVMPKLEQWEQHCRQRAAHYRALRTVPGVDPLTQLLYCLAEMFWRLAAGFASGLAAGYASHLVLDAFTPRGLPLLAR